MPLTVGSRLGPYEILGALGEGGMGQVYRARDTRLGRTVAVKILHSALAIDPSFARRFENEARTLSRIAHPNICVLHDVDLGDPAYLVLEYLEGDPLEKRIAAGPLPFDEVRRIGVEICRALDTAHKAGIVHRDLKPANVMLTRTGAKLLDFGIALEQHRGAPTNLTTTIALTQPGSIIGTAAYMAPEQLEGLPADARSDIFALGAMLYEAATGRRAFPGESPAAITAAILSSDPPPPSASRSSLPAAFDAIVAGCLARNPDDRWQSAHDVGRQLESLASRTGVSAPAPAFSSRVPAWLPWAVTLLAIAAAIGVWTWRRPAASTRPGTVALKVLLPVGTTLLDTVEGDGIALSPDGSQLAWAAAGADGTPQLWLRPLSQLEGRPLPGTEGATSIFWSPDGRSIAFFGRGLLQRLDLEAAAPVVICPVQRGIGYSGTWGADGHILFAPVQGDAIMRVPTSGGTPERLYLADANKGGARIGWPSYLPDGRSALYFLRRGADATTASLMLGRADGSSQEISDLTTKAQYVDPGALVFVRGGTLLTQRFDAASGRLSGEAVPLASNVRNFPASGWAGFSAARNGTVAFLNTPRDLHLAWIDSTGYATEQLGTPGNYLGIHNGPDAQTVWVTRMDNASGVYDIWSIDIARGTESRVTTGPSTNIGPLLVPGRPSTMIYSKTTSAAPELYERDLATGTERILAPGRGFQQAVSITRDGGTLVYLQRANPGNWDVWTLNLNDARTPEPLLATPFGESDALLSPDDRMIAFVSDETGHAEIYVAAFPRVTAKLRLSTGGGRLPRWSGDHRLMFLANDGRLMRAEVTFDGTVHAGAPVSVFPQPLKVPWRDFLPLGDGRVLAIVGEDPGQEHPLTVVTNAVR